MRSIFKRPPTEATVCLNRLEETGLQAWIITPNVGYTVIESDVQKIELYAGARYFWIEVDATFGWRYLHYDIGSDTALKELNLNGPFAGVIFRW
jgi:hypothetical protein